MKTMMDAVKHYGGYNFVHGKHEKHHTHMLYGHLDNKIFTSYASDVGVATAICSIDEYNALIAKLELNLGRCNTYMFSNYRDAVATGNINNSTPSPKPIYTQEMADVGELPSVGVTVLFNDDISFECKYDWSDGDELECVFHSTDCMGDPIGVYRHDNGVTVSLVTDLIRCKPASIELIDGKAYQYTYGGSDGINGIYSKEFNSFSEHMKVYNTELCANIKPLTPEGES